MQATVDSTSTLIGPSSLNFPPSAPTRTLPPPDLTLPKNQRYLRLAPELPPNVIHLDDHRTVRYGTPDDLPFVLHLQNKHHNACGYSPPAAILERLATRRILLLVENGEPGGWISFTHREDRLTHLPQMAVAQDLWRTHAGTVLADTLFDLAQLAGSHALTLRSAIDIPANFFWPTLGMTPVAVTTGKRRTLVHWGIRWDGLPLDLLPLPHAGGLKKWGKHPG